MNYAAYQIATANGTQLNTTTPCATLVASTKTGLVGGALPSNVTITTDTTCASVAAGTSVSCVLTSSDDATKTATANVICTN